MTVTVVIGGGPVGCLAALYMAKWHHDDDVVVVEARATMGKSNRSINLALSHRGLRAIKEIDDELYDRILKVAVPVKGRMIHYKDGKMVEHEYGCFGESIYSIDRHIVSHLLMEKVLGCCKVFRGCKVTHVECANDSASVTVEKNSSTTATIACDLVLGCDGVHSITRDHINNFSSPAILSKIRYKEIQIPAGRGLSEHHLHIWPRPPHDMFMALPNVDGTFTATFFTDLPDDKVSLDDVMMDYKDILPYVHLNEMIKEWHENPLASLWTVPPGVLWNVDDKIVVLGDAAHGMLPFYGQGLNAGLEDVRVLSQFILDGKTIKEYVRHRKPDTAAMQQLSIDNWREMNGGELKMFYSLKRWIVRRLHTIFPSCITPLYTMLAFTDTRYSTAMLVDKIYSQLLASSICLLCTALLVWSIHNIFIT